MFSTSLVSNPVALVAKGSSKARSAKHPRRRSFATMTTASQPGASVSSGDAPATMMSRRAVFGLSAGAVMAATLTGSPGPASAASARVERRVIDDLSSLGEKEQEYRQLTLALIGSTTALVEGTSTDVDAWLSQSSAWNDRAKDMYSPKKQGKSFLMTTKLVAYLRNSLATIDGQAGFNPSSPPYSIDKTKEWIQYAQGFTSGELRGDEVGRARMQ